MQGKIFTAKKVFIFIFCVLFTVSKGVTRIALSSGAWNVAGTWSGNAVPACGDSIVIPAPFTVTVTVSENYSGCVGAMKLTIQGVHLFINGRKIQLPCNSMVVVYPGGSIQASGGGGANNQIEICNEVVWQTSDGPFTGPNCLPAGSPGCITLLPVELSNFTATVNGSEVDLLWTTKSEKNSLKFEVERGLDAVNFLKIAAVDSKAKGGNSQLPIDYFLADKNPLSNTNYYRLKQVDIDQSFNYTHIVSVSNIKDKNIQFVVYPNPNHGEFTADISGVENNHNVGIFLYDQKGTLHYRSNFFVHDQTTKVQIVPDHKLANGIYVCTLMVEEIAFKLKVVVN